ALTEDEIVVAGWRMPVDPQGRSRPGSPPNRLSLPNPVWDRLAVWFGVRPLAIDFLKPYAFQSVDLVNRSGQPVSLLVNAQTLAPKTGEPAPWFQPPRWYPGAGPNQTAAFVEVPAKDRATCVLPIHIGHDTPAGTYQSHITITPLGSERVLAELTAPLGVTRSRPFLTLWVLFAVVLSGSWLVALLVLYRRLVRGMGVRLLVLLSLLGSLQFCLQLVGGWISNIFYAVLGPFNCLVGGFLTELLTYLLVTSILCVVPRVGAMTLAGVVSYLMGAILFGSVGLTDLLFIGSAIAFREILLFVFGVTRFGTREKPPRLVPMMLALGLADAASAFTSLALFAVFYRLFYADWYIALNVIVTGFLYTCIGVFLGRRLGLSLRKVHL
ncbi:hypothetical protein HQ520_04935, partial [bacterium]|nr:hypothetical protein [bacterium]